jgi:UTP:GlnB (protein PII) uridylyltransferase
VKELEQLLQSLEAQERIKKNEEFGSSSSPTSYGMKLSSCEENEVKAENKSEAADIKVTLIQTHVNLKIECKKRHGQLIKVIVALENLRLSILHLNITSFDSSVLYSLNLKVLLCLFTHLLLLLFFF